MGRLIQKLSYEQVATLFKSHNYAAELVSAFNTIFARVCQLRDATSLLEILRDNKESVRVVKPVLYAINQALEFLKTCSNIFDYLCFDTFELSPVVQQLCQSKILTETLMSAI